ncbi:MAG: hypothetical protein ACOY8P_13120 [Thermodesulfobacteriota bacterium]
MEHEIEAERLKLKNILNNEKNNGDMNKELKDLALRVGASTVNPYAGHGDASSPQLVFNIHQALQTKGMIGALQISRRYVIVTIVLAFITLGAAIATWWGALAATACDKCGASQAFEATTTGSPAPQRQR